MKKIGMILGLKLGLAIFCAMAAMSAAAFAEDVKPAAPAISADDLKKALGLSIYLQGGYTYNGNASASGPFDDTGNGEQNDFRVFDHKANSFTLDLAQIVFQKDPALGNVGYKVKFSAGETAKLIHAAGMGASGESFDVTEAYMSYNAAVGKGLRFDFGKMVTFFGAEVIEAIDNPNYSRSFLFNYAIPFTHTGLKASYVFSDALNAAVYIVNGWDNATDNNRGKSYGVSVGYTPAESFSLLINGMTGPEQNEQGANGPTVGSSSSNQRTLLDIVATIKPVKPLSIILNYDDGREDNVPGTLLPSGTSSDAKWDGLAGIIKYDFNDTYSLAVRGEYFDDKDGFRTGTVQKLKEVTVTPEIRLNGGVILRPEYRHDTSDKTSFDIVNGTATKKSQDTIALGVMYRW
jgi:hypothetical protein